jgi:hypothetical protein
MRYELRTTLLLRSGSPLVLEEIRRADRLLRTLYESLPTEATLGADVATPAWYGNRYNEPDIELQIATRYRNVFGLTADRFRIEDALEPVLATSSNWLKVKYDVLRVYGDAELVDPVDPSKKASHPC